MRSRTTPACHRRRLRTAVLAATLLFLVAATAATAAESNEEKPTPAIDDLLSKQFQTRDNAVDAVLRDRKSVIEQLIPLIDPDNATQYSDQTRCAAAYLLGKLRAVEAVPVLSRALADEPGPKERARISRYDVPVWTALVRIGRPAVPVMIENIESSDHGMLPIGSLGVLNHVLGGKRRLLELLVKLDERSTDSEISRRIKEARSWAEGHYKEDKEPLY